MISSIFHVGTFSIETVAAAMATALVLGILIALLYKRGTVYVENLSVVLAVLPLMISTVIMIVNGNLGTSVAVLGAFGLVRFRSAPGSARELGFIFYAMAVGLAAGMGFLTMAALITLVIGAVLFVLEKIRFGDHASKERELRITIPEDLNYNGIFDEPFEAYTKYAHLERVKTTNMGTMYELSYRIEMKDEADQKALIDELRCRNGNLGIILGLVQRERNEL